MTTATATEQTATETATLRLTVYRAADRMDCTAGGESSRYATVALVGTVDKRYPNDLNTRTVAPLSADYHLPTSTAEHLSRPAGEPHAAFPAALVVRNMGRAAVFHLEPVQLDADGAWVLHDDSAGHRMDGGNLADATDSRLRQILAAFTPGDDLTGSPFQTALSIHDRVEPWKR